MFLEMRVPREPCAAKHPRSRVVEGRSQITVVFFGEVATGWEPGPLEDTTPESRSMWLFRQEPRGLRQIPAFFWAKLGCPTRRLQTQEFTSKLGCREK